MNVLIVGFDDYNELDAVMQKLIEEKQFFLFNVIIGGTAVPSFGEVQYVSLAHEWAVKNGAPLYVCTNNDIKILMRELGKMTDYLVIKITDRTPALWKQFLQKMSAAGKHGTVIREESIC